MSENPSTPEDRGQVGIETLIIFIAMILVAAIAAGILINTAGFLQNKAEATSHDSTEQVSNQLVVQSAIGQVGPDGTNVTSLNLTVMLSPGADEIDLAETTLEWVGPEGATTLGFDDVDPPILLPGCSTSIPCYIVVGTLDDDLSEPVLNDRSDRFTIHVPLRNSSTAPTYLQGGEEATLNLVTESGSRYTHVVDVPESLSSHSDSAVMV